MSSYETFESGVRERVVAVSVARRRWRAEGGKTRETLGVGLRGSNVASERVVEHHRRAGARYAVVHARDPDRALRCADLGMHAEVGDLNERVCRGAREGAAAGAIPLQGDGKERWRVAAARVDDGHRDAGDHRLVRGRTGADGKPLHGRAAQKHGPERIDAPRITIQHPRLETIRHRRDGRDDRVDVHMLHRQGAKADALDELMTEGMNDGGRVAGRTKARRRIPAQPLAEDVPQRRIDNHGIGHARTKLGVERPRYGLGDRITNSKRRLWKQSQTLRDLGTAHRIRERELQRAGRAVVLVVGALE